MTYHAAYPQSLMVIAGRKTSLQSQRTRLYERYRNRHTLRP